MPKDEFLGLSSEGPFFVRELLIYFSQIKLHSLTYELQKKKKKCYKGFEGLSFFHCRLKLQVMNFLLNHRN